MVLPLIRTVLKEEDLIKTELEKKEQSLTGHLLKIPDESPFFQRYKNQLILSHIGKTIKMFCIH